MMLFAASVKNFQLQMEGAQDPNQVSLQFGKTGDSTFTMDYSYPLSPLQAFQVRIRKLRFAALLAGICSSAVCASLRAGALSGSHPNLIPGASLKNAAVCRSCCRPSTTSGRASNIFLRGGPEAG